MPPPLADSPIRARQIVEALHEPLLVLDADFRVRHANPAFHRSFGTTADETLGVPLFELRDGQWDIAELRDRLGDVIRTSEPAERFRVDHTFPGLGRRVMRLNVRPLVGDGGATRHVLLAIDDVTRQVEFEEKLRDQASTLRRHARELERSNEELEQFAYVASHDLQEPLRMVASYLELLERRHRDELDEEAREFIDYAVDGARRMKALIDGLLQYSRVGRKEGAFGEVDLDAVLDDVLDDLAGQIDEKGAEVSREALPVAHGNRDQLRRVLQNLIENALAHSGGAPPRIEVTGRRVGDGGVRIAVSDDGPGIPPEASDKVFHLFHQLDPHGEGREGSGMGLAICRKIVERHGGRIGVESGPNGGSTFYFTLDLEPEETP